MPPFVNSETKYFAALFFEGKFEVPWYQRRYDWKKEHIIDLLADIDHAMENEKEFYFLGSLLLVNKEKNIRSVNDGQQRMTTYSLICARFLRLFHEKGESHLEAQAMRILFDIEPHQARKLTDAEDLAPRLAPSRDDKSRFNLLIRGQNISANGRLTQAWNEIDKFVSALSIEKARKYFQFLTEKIEVSSLTIPPSADPNMIFEALNSRGKPLEDFDLIRNHLYAFFNAPSEANRRDTVKENLDVQLRHKLIVGNSDKVMEYARCYLQCEYGFLPKERFYRNVRENIARHLKDTTEKPADYVFGLVERLTNEWYPQLFITLARQETNADVIDKFNKDARQTGKKRNLKVLLDELRGYTVTQPIIFALLSRYVQAQVFDIDTKSMAKIVYGAIKNINAFVMRTALVERKFEPSRFESELSDMARKIMKANSIDTLLKIDIFKQLSSLASSSVTVDEKFIEEMSTLEIKGSTDKAKRFLFAINADSQSDAEAIHYPNVTLEHILPKGDTHWEGWKSFEAGSHDEYAHRIGNLTLLGGGDNKPSQKDNKNWNVKKNTLTNSMLSINKEFEDIEDWSPESINKRQKRLAKLSSKIWSFTKGKLSE